MVIMDNLRIIQNLWFSVTLIIFELGPWRDTLHLGRNRSLKNITLVSLKDFN